MLTREESGGTKMRQTSFATGLIAGAAIGTVAALLFAPKPGKVTRRFVAHRSRNLRGKAGGFASYLREKMQREERPEEVGVSTNGHVG